MLKEQARSTRRKMLDDLKLKTGCVDCGYAEHAIALDFDHLPQFQKRFNISQQLFRRSWEALLREIEKCEVVCSNCHRVREYMRRHDESNGSTGKCAQLVDAQ